MGFSDRLRMANIFPSGESSFGDFNLGGNPFEGLMSMMQNQSAMMPPPVLNQIANDVVSPPMNVVFKDDSTTPYQKEIIALRAKELGQRDESQDANRVLAKQRIDQGQQRVDIAKQKADNPNLRIIAQKDGNVVGYDPVTGESKIIGTHGLSETDRIQKNQENAIERIDHTSETAEARALRLEAERQKNRVTNEGTAQTNRIALKGTETPKTETELDEQRRVTNNYSKMLNEHPEWREFVEPDQAGNPVLKDVATSWYHSGRPDKATYTEIYNYLYGTASPTVTTNPVVPVTTTPKAGDTRTVYREGKPFKVPTTTPEAQLKRDGFSLTK